MPLCLLSRDNAHKGGSHVTTTSTCYNIFTWDPPRPGPSSLTVTIQRPPQPQARAPDHTATPQTFSKLFTMNPYHQQTGSWPSIEMLLVKPSASLLCSYNIYFIPRAKDMAMNNEKFDSLNNCNFRRVYVFRNFTIGISRYSMNILKRNSTFPQFCQRRSWSSLESQGVTVTIQDSPLVHFKRQRPLMNLFFFSVDRSIGPEYTSIAYICVLPYEYPNSIVVCGLENSEWKVTQYNMNTGEAVTSAVLERTAQRFNSRGNTQ